MMVELKLSEQDSKRQINGYFCYKCSGIMWGIVFFVGALLLLWLLTLLRAQYLVGIRRFLAGICVFMTIFFVTILLFMYVNLTKNSKNNFQKHNREGFLRSRVSLEGNLFTLENVDVGNAVTHTLTPEHKVRANKRVIVILSPQKQDLVILPNLAEVRALFEENHIPVSK